MALPLRPRRARGHLVTQMMVAVRTPDTFSTFESTKSACGTAKSGERSSEISPQTTRIERQ